MKDSLTLKWFWSFYHQIFLRLRLNYAEEPIGSCFSICNAVSVEFVVDKLGCDKERVGDCWLIYDVGFDVFRFEFNILLSISEPVLCSKSINN
jgi:hypothetical protein